MEIYPSQKNIYINLRPLKFKVDEWLINTEIQLSHFKKKILLQPRAPIRRDEMRSQWIHQWGPVEKKSVTVEPTSDLFLGMVPTSQNSFSTTATCFRSLVSVPTPNNTHLTSNFCSYLLRLIKEIEFEARNETVIFFWEL